MQPLPSLLTLLAAPGLVAQTVWNVPDGHFVDPYIAQASPGDIVLLGGNHDVFHVDKALTIIGRGTDPLSGSYVSGFTSMHITAPVGARVTLIGFRLVVYSWTGGAIGGILGYGGRIAVSDVVSNQSITLMEDSVLERVEITNGGLGVSGTASITDCTVRGRDFVHSALHGPIASTPALWLGGGARVVASHAAFRGGVGSASAPAWSQASSAAIVVTNASLWLTDSVVAGGDGAIGSAAFPGGVAIDASASSANVHVARTTLTDGIGAPGASTGHHVTAAMVGMHGTAPPTRGATFVATATAGDSQGLLGIVGGFDRTANVLPAPFVEPVFGALGQCVTLALAVPAAGAPVPASVVVPNVSGLLGVELWLQAVQLAGSGIRASTLVGGGIR